MRKVLFLLIMGLCLCSCRTTKTATIDTQTETHTRDSVVCDSTYVIVQHQQSVTDSVTVETVIEKTTVITVDLDGKEIYRETNCNTTTNRDRYRGEKQSDNKETTSNHKEIVNSTDSLYKGHWEETVVSEKPNIFQRIKNDIAYLVAFVVIVLILKACIEYGKKKRK
ncbi:MAG: hypothetical protein MJZ30_07610 [Paludibacteraceae bacterium]|nr:hypothetical protein [Paludibacteraceae bacterium]